MEKLLVYPAGSTKACLFASKFLQKYGVAIVDHPTPEVTHLLLDVPSFAPDGTLRGGGDLEKLLRMLPGSLTVIGGNLNHPSLDGYHAIDLLSNETYLAQNAAITAECALQVAAGNMETTFADTPVLIIGWGRIGKCLSQILRALGCYVSVAVRKDSDLAMLQALGFDSISISDIQRILPNYRLIINTAPAPVLPAAITESRQNCLFLDLASQKGLLGDRVIWARGLPGIYAPESSGKLIAMSLLKQCKEVLP